MRAFLVGILAGLPAISWAADAASEAATNAPGEALGASPVASFLPLILIFLVFYFLFRCYCHIARTARQQTAKHLRVYCAFGAVSAPNNHRLHAVKQPFFYYCFVLALVDFAAIAEMSVIKRVG